MTSTNTTTVAQMFFNCRLGRSELDRMYAVAQEGTVRTAARFTLRHDLGTFEGGSLHEVLATRSASSLSVPDAKAEWLDFTAEDEAAGRKIYIGCRSSVIGVRVSGSDAMWVYGQYARVKILLEGAGGREKRVTYINQGVYELAFFVLAASFAASAAVGSPGWVDVLLSCIAVGGSVFLSLRKLVAVKMRRGMLRLDGELSMQSGWRRMNVTDRIAMGGVVFAGVSAIAAVLALFYAT